MYYVFNQNSFLYTLKDWVLELASDQPEAIYLLRDGTRIQTYTPASFQGLCSYHYTTVLSLNKNSCENLYPLDKYNESIYTRTPQTIVLNTERPGLLNCFIR